MPPEGDDTDNESEAPFDVVAGTVREQVRTIEYHGFTAECPFADRTDQYGISITYRGQDAAETDSVTEFLDGYEGVEISGEALAEAVYDAFTDEFGRSNVNVTLYQRDNSGVTLTIEQGGTV